MFAEKCGNKVDRKLERNALIDWNLLDTINHPLFYFYFKDDDFGERSVSVSLDGVESELIFIDHTSGEMSVSGNISYFDEYLREIRTNKQFSE